MILLLLGAPGSGKGTQGRRLSEQLNVPYLASGDLLRTAIEQGTSFGRQVREYIERGLYVPDDIMVPAAIEALDKILHSENKGGVVLDGFPRTREQAEALDSALTAQRNQVDRVLLLNVPKTVLIPRLAGRRVCRGCGASYHTETKPPRTPGTCDRCGAEVVQRVDDKPEMVDGRLTVYFERTLPMIAYYQQQGKLTQIDGNRSEEEITADLVAAAAVTSGAVAG